MKLFKTLGLKRKIHHQHQLVRKTKKPALRQQDGPKRPAGANQLSHQEVCYTPYCNYQYITPPGFLHLKS